eukprot:m.58351 g.58351  ORF g.58351 m.58351 type:complete len:52 (-) comp22532_c0_seq2:48-203(-)
MGGASLEIPQKGGVWNCVKMIVISSCGVVYLKQMFKSSPQVLGLDLNKQKG